MDVCVPKEHKTLFKNSLKRLKILNGDFNKIISVLLYNGWYFNEDDKLTPPSLENRFEMILGYEPYEFSDKIDYDGIINHITESINKGVYSKTSYRVGYVDRWELNSCFWDYKITDKLIKSLIEDGIN